MICVAVNGHLCQAGRLRGMVYSWVGTCRKLAKDAEQNKGKGGIWGYIAGN